MVERGRKITYGIVQPGGFVSDGVPLVRGGDYSNGWATLADIKRVRPEIDAPYKRSRLRPGDILLTIVGANTGHTAVVPDWLEGANITQTTARIAVNHQLAEPTYILHWLRSQFGQDEVRKYVKGAAQPGLNLEDVERFALVAPSVPEQRRIAAVLDDWDDAVAAAELLAESTNIHEHAALRRLLQPIPETELSDVATVIMGQSPPSSSYCDAATVGAIPLVQGAADFDGISVRPQKGTQQPSKVVSVPAVVMSVRAPVGTTAISRTKICIGRGVCAIIPRTMSLELTSVLLAYASTYWRTVAQGGMFEAVGGVEVRAAPVANIPGHLQSALSGYATAMIRGEWYRNERVALLRRQKRGLMQKLLTGEWRVPAIGDACTPGGPAADRLEVAE